MRRLLALGIAALAASCSGTATEIVLVVDTDLAGVDRFEVDAAYPGGGSGSSWADLTVREPPRTLVLVHRGGPHGPVELTVSGLGGGATLASARREVTFEEGESLTLHVRLTASCVAGGCPAGQTCDDGGGCRSPVVRACEYEGRSCSSADGGLDAGTRSDADAGPPGDGGGCRVASVCGVPSELLPGDRIVPVPCGAAEEPVTARVEGPGGLVAPEEGSPSDFVLEVPGDYTVRLSAGPGCAASAAATVVTSEAIEDVGGVSSGALRDFAARAGAAFVAGQDGIYAVDTAGWWDLLDVASGDVPPGTDFGAVTVHDTQPIFGPHDNRNAMWRAIVSAPFSSASFQEIPLAGGSREVRALASRLDRAGPVVAATKDGVMVVETVASAPTVRSVGSSYDPSDLGWAAVGEVEEAGRGAVWVGMGDELVNRALGAGTTFADGAGVAIADWLTSVHAAEVDDRVAGSARLWLCGDGGVAIYGLRGDWSGLSTLPSPDDTWRGGACHDLALGEDGQAWVAAGPMGLIRLGVDGAVLALHDSARGLPAGASVDRVATASGAARREVWMLDRSADPPVVRVLSARRAP